MSKMYSQGWLAERWRFALKSMKFVVKMMDFVLKMMILMQMGRGLEPVATGAGLEFIK